MKHLWVCLLFLSVNHSAGAQNDFTGIAKYRITVEGSNNPITDSMSVIFSKQKVKVILYLPDLTSSGHVSEKVFIDDFSTKKSTALNTEDKTYKTDSLNITPKYNFINTQKIVASSNNLLCFQYTVDPGNIDTSRILSADCFASIDYRNSFISNYSFLGIQPVIIDNRIVMDFNITQPDGVKQRIYISDIKKMDDVENYFNLTEYKEVK
ncbi:MAG: hypothetical protein ABJA71_02065 [Ginsengibacter sp.]